MAGVLTIVNITWPATSAPPNAVVWSDGADSLLVLLDTVRVETADGL